MLRFLESPWLACVVNFGVAVFLLWSGWTHRGAIYNVVVWYVKWRYRNLRLPDGMPERNTRWIFFVFGFVLLCAATYYGYRGAGIIQDKPPPTREEIEALRERFNQVRAARAANKPAGPVEPAAPEVH